MLGLILMTLGLITSAGGCFQQQDINTINANFKQLFGANTPFSAKLQRLASAARSSNPLVNLPLQAVAAWQSGTVYAYGNVVSNGGNNYLCYVGGTSAGSGGPTGTSAAPITDNTVTWLFYGVTNPTSNSLAAPTLTFQSTNAAGLTNAYVPVTNDAQFFYSGGVPVAVSSGYRFKTSLGQVTGNVSGNYSNFGYRISFITDAPKFSVQFGQATTIPIRFIVDGQYVSLSGLSASNSGSANYFILDFTSAGGRKMRNISIESQGASTFFSVNVDYASEIWAPSSADNVRAMVVGDSFVAGGNSFPILSESGWAFQLADTLGWNDPWNQGQGGTGYLATNSGSGFNFLQRITDVTANSPDLLIVLGSGHDNAPAFTASQVTAQVLNYLATMRSTLPKLPIILMGLLPIGGAPSAAAINTENAIASAVAQFNDANVFFQPIGTLSQLIFTGSGNITAMTGVGNGDVYIGSDGTHPDQSGEEYLSRRMTTFVRSIIPQFTT